MKIAIAGKGGAGKSFIAASLARLYAGCGAPAQQERRICEERAQRERQVYALDADPCGSLGLALGLSHEEIENVKPIIDMREFIEPGKEDGDLYLSAPDVDNIGGHYNAMVEGVNFLRMACLKQAEAGCYCQEFSFLQALIKSMSLGENDVLILDTAAGVEHFTRGAIKGIDMLLIVSEATRACIETSRIIKTLGADLGIRRIYYIANKIRSEKEELLVRASFRRDELIGLVRMSEAIADQSIGVGSKRNPPLFITLPEIEQIFQKLQSI